MIDIVAKHDVSKQIWWTRHHNKTPGWLHLNSAGSASILISLTGPVEDRDWIRVSEELADFLGFEVRSGGNHSFN